MLLERARVAEEAQVEILESLSVFPSTLPTKRESAYAAWVSISVGCNNTCTFCIVPALRGKEKDRRPGEILAEVEALVAEGVTEITLLGQNVNAYGVEFGDRQAFSKLLRACGAIEGLERVRFTSPHPAEFTDDVIEAMAETPNVMPSLHMPLQSGSDAVLRAMRRSYRQSKYLGIIERVRAAIPDAAITTDIIVGFPGETEEDFQATLDVVRAARFSAAFTFQYSKRPGTPAAVLEDQVPPEVVKDRYQRLVEVVDEIAWAENKALVGRTVELMVAEGEGRKDAATQRLSGRARDNRLVHFAADFSAVAGGLGAPRRHGDRRDHLRRPAPPRRRQRDPVGPPHPRRRRLGASYVRPAGRVRRRARHAVGRRARAPPARGQRLRLTPALPPCRSPDSRGLAPRAWSDPSHQVTRTFHDLAYPQIAARGIAPPHAAGAIVDAVTERRCALLLAPERRRLARPGPAGGPRRPTTYAGSCAAASSRRSSRRLRRPHGRADLGAAGLGRGAGRAASPTRRRRWQLGAALAGASAMRAADGPGRPGARGRPDPRCVIPQAAGWSHRTACR